MVLICYVDFKNKLFLFAGSTIGIGSSAEEDIGGLPTYVIRPRIFDHAQI